MSAADIEPGTLIINPDGSINVDVLEKIRREYKGKSFIKNMYAKALLLCLNTIADKYYKGSKPGEIDRTKRLDPAVARDINEQFNALLSELSKEQDRTVKEHRDFLREKVSMFIEGNLRRLRELQHSRMSKRGLVDTHKDAMRELGAKLREDETIIDEDQSFKDFMIDLESADKGDFENGTRGVFLFAIKVMGSNLKDAVVGGAVAAKQKIGAAAVAAKDTAAGVLHRRGKSGEVKVAEISSPIGIKPHSPTNANVKKPEQPAEYKRPSVAPREQHGATQQPAEYNNPKDKDARRPQSLEKEYGRRPAPPPPPRTDKQPPPLPKSRPVDETDARSRHSLERQYNKQVPPPPPPKQAPKQETARKAPPPLPNKATMDTERAKRAGTQQDSAKPVVYGGVQLKKTQPNMQKSVEKPKTEFQKMHEKFEKRGNESNNPPKRGPSPGGNSI